MSDRHGSGAVVRGTVRGRDGRPVEGARVVITASPVPVPEIAAVTDADGRFAMAAPAPGEYTFSAHADDVAGPATGSVRVPPHAAGPAVHASTAAIPRIAALAADADMSSDDPIPPTASAAPAAEVHVVLTFPS